MRTRYLSRSFVLLVTVIVVLATVPGLAAAEARAGGSVVVYGTVDGDVTVGAERVVLGSTASVPGDLTYDGKLQGPRSTVAGTITRDASLGGPTVFQPAPAFSDWVLGVYGFLVNLALGAVLLLAFPRFSRRVTEDAVGGPARAVAVGLVMLVGVPILLVLTAVTIIGIPLTIVGAMLFGVLAWVGAVYGRIAVGTWLTSYTAVESRWAALVAEFLVVGVAVRVPFVGWIPELLVGLLGLGALALVPVALVPVASYRYAVRRFDGSPLA